MVMCCLPSFKSVARHGRPKVGVELDPMELLRFVANDFGPMIEISDAAETGQ